MADKKKKNPGNAHDLQESDSKNRTEMLNNNQIDEVAKMPPKKEWEPKKKDEIL